MGRSSWWLLAWLWCAPAIGSEVVEEPALIPELPVVVEPVDPLAASLLAHNTARRRDQIRSMSVLLGWSVANMGVGAAGWATAKEPEWRAFHQMNLAWNVINLSLAVPGLVAGLREDPARLDLGGTLRASARTRTTFAVNTGLDVGWIMAGAWMWERGLRTDDPRLVGFGRSVVMQGGFLFAFDLAMWLTRGAKDRRLMLVPSVAGTLGVGLTGRL
jgi:hypothetical protein